MTENKNSSEEFKKKYEKYREDREFNRILGTIVNAVGANRAIKISEEEKRKKETNLVNEFNSSSKELRKKIVDAYDFVKITENNKIILNEKKGDRISVEYSKKALKELERIGNKMKIEQSRNSSIELS